MAGIQWFKIDYRQFWWKQHEKCTVNNMTSRAIVEELEIVVTWCYIKAIHLTVMEFCWRLLSFLCHIALTAGGGGLMSEFQKHWISLIIIFTMKEWYLMGSWLDILKILWNLGDRRHLLYVHTRRTVILKKCYRSNRTVWRTSGEVFCSLLMSFERNECLFFASFP